MNNKSKNNVYFITGGGTGGHIYPAIAIIDRLKKAGKEVFYVGNPKNPEFRLAKENNIAFLPVNINGMPRKMSFSSIFWAVKLCFAILISMIYIFKYRPHTVFGTGGYVSAPILFAAKMLNIPYALHDADAQPGIVTRCLASRAVFLTTPFESVKNILPAANVIVTGNPIREDFSLITKDEARAKLGLQNKLTLLVMGGSQGARAINHNVIPVLKKLIDEFNINIVHQTGKKNYEDSKELLNKEFNDYQKYNNYRLLAYIDDMPTTLKASDIVVSRSGSLSLSEIKTSGAASILIPYPYAAGNHQLKNAQAMVQESCSILIEEKDLSSDRLFEEIKNLIVSKEKLINMQSSALNKAMPNATQNIVKLLLEI